MPGWDAEVFGGLSHAAFQVGHELADGALPLVEFSQCFEDPVGGEGGLPASPDGVRLLDGNLLQGSAAAGPVVVDDQVPDHGEQPRPDIFAARAQVPGVLPDAGRTGTGAGPPPATTSMGTGEVGHYLGTHSEATIASGVHPLCCAMHARA